MRVLTFGLISTCTGHCVNMYNVDLASCFFTCTFFVCTGVFAMMPNVKRPFLTFVKPLPHKKVSIVLSQISDDSSYHSLSIFNFNI